MNLIDILEMRPVIWEKDDVVQKENFDQLYPQFLEPNLVQIEADLVKNGTGYLVGDSVNMMISNHIFDYN